jgi:hypothetical protein
MSVQKIFAASRLRQRKEALRRCMDVHGDGDIMPDIDKDEMFVVRFPEIAKQLYFM